MSTMGGRIFSCFPISSYFSRREDAALFLYDQNLEKYVPEQEKIRKIASEQEVKAMFDDHEEVFLVNEFRSTRIVSLDIGLKLIEGLHLIMANYMHTSNLEIKGGESGSPIVTDNGTWVALLTAASENSITACPLYRIAARYGLLPYRELQAVRPYEQRIHTYFSKLPLVDGTVDESLVNIAERYS